MKKDAKLILGGGAAYGLAHIGAIAAISEEFDITGIVGTSMGAIIGGLYAMGKTPEEILQIAKDSKNSLIFNPLKVSKLPKSLPANLLRGFHERKPILGLFESWTADILIENLQLPFVAVAYDLTSRMTIEIDNGPLAKAMRASSSLPLLFPPFAYGQYLFVDGGVEHPLPIAFGNSVPGSFTIAINVLPPVAMQSRKLTAQGSPVRNRLLPHQVFIRTVLHNQSYLAIQGLLHNPPDLFIDAHDAAKKMFDLFDAQTFYDYGYQAAVTSLESLSEPNFMSKLVLKYQSLLAKFYRK